MKVVYLGDFIKRNGPSMVDINLTNELSEYVQKVQINKNYKSILKDISSSDIINISGISLKGVFYSIIGKIMGKKITYIMHGALKIEKQYRNISKYRLLYEKIIIMLANRIICVSSKFEEMVKNEYNLNKIISINNGINLEKKNDLKEVNRDIHQIITVGGGRKEKGIIAICEAIKLIDKKITLVVAGEDGVDTEAIKEYEFVDYKGFINHSELINIMKNSNIFIQNSYYEPFGITVLEAITNGCKVIISDNIGAPINGLEEFTVSNDDTKSIAKLIDELIQNRDIQEINTDFINDLTWSSASNHYIDLWKSMI